MFFAGLICTPAVPRRDVDICFCTDAASRKSTNGKAPRQLQLERHALKAPPTKKTKKTVMCVSLFFITCVLMFLFVCP